VVHPRHVNTRVSRFIRRKTAEKTPLGSIDVDYIDSVELRQAFYARADEALDNLDLPHETREQIAGELRLVVRPPTEDTPKRLRIGLGALLPDDK
jgi:acetyl-CoA carboxylase carboxyltransferase component